MTQEEKAKILEAEINHIIESGANSIRLIECFKRHFERHYHQQPIPQDINVFIESEAEKDCPDHYTDFHEGQKWRAFKRGANALAQLLLPQLQQLREELIHRGNIIEIDRVQIEQQKSQIDTFTKTLVEYAEQIVKQEAERKERAAEIESLKKEIGELKEINEGLRLSRNEYREAWENRYGKTT